MGAMPPSTLEPTMKWNIPRAARRVAALLPAVGLMLAPLAAGARDKEVTEVSGNTRNDLRVPELGVTGRAGAITEFNLGPPAASAFQSEETRVLSGRVIELEGQTLYVERQGLVVPLDMSMLRITKQPQAGQQIIAEYQVEETQNVALSLAGEVAPE